MGRASTNLIHRLVLFPGASAAFRLPWPQGVQHTYRDEKCSYNIARVRGTNLYMQQQQLARTRKHRMHAAAKARVVQAALGPRQEWWHRGEDSI